jgi:hypothetical protein
MAYLRDNRRELPNRLVQGICLRLNTGRLIDEVAIVERTKRSHTTALSKQFAVQGHGRATAASPLALPLALPLASITATLLTFSLLLLLPLDFTAVTNHFYIRHRF